MFEHSVNSALLVKVYQEDLDLTKCQCVIHKTTPFHPHVKCLFLIIYTLGYHCIGILLNLPALYIFILILISTFELIVGLYRIPLLLYN